jgi:hypothetical protein
MNPTFLVKTQILENYDHSGNNAYWKFKGGNDYLITGLHRIQDAVALVGDRCSNTPFSKEFPLEWSEVPGDYQTDSERSQLEYEGKITYPATRIHL